MKSKLQITLLSIFLVLFIAFFYFLSKDKNSDILDFSNPILSKNSTNSSYSIDEITKIYSNTLTWWKLVNSLEFKFIKEISNSFSWDLNISNTSNSGYSISKLDTILSNYKNTLTYNIELNILDYSTKLYIWEWQVYINWFYIWDFKDWKFNWTFKWLKNIELFNIVVKSKNYWDWFLTLNAINSNWTLLLSDVLLKKAEIKNITLPNTWEISFNNFKIKLPECALVDNSWNCFKWKVDIKTNYISSDEANSSKLSLNMKALNDWNVAYLKSWWMAFIDFITPTREILKLKDNTTYELTYNISQDDIENMWEIWWTNWFWYYDKLKWLWLKSSAIWVINKETKTITFQADKLY